MTRIILFVFIFLTTGYVYAQPTSIGKLDSINCSDPHPKVELSSDNQRYWYPRMLPGTARDNTCYLGFPKENANSALVMVNGEIIAVYPDDSNNQNGLTIFKSKDEKTIVEIKVTGSYSTCEPDADKCCGDVTYATITITHRGKKSEVKAENYIGS